ncbi:uncharacterized protein B0J16DRAFT_185701 [Fusarium flagelliforme]|uniref:uncharacterized protein n=1 Tax=Fusarium flagelliforme TaxID=2675880 RepID=UPI001E8EEC1C|nr:uncharacterized protein B0J16DRAFT_185701 [Fusarium flagelliforme]KAH7174851.1 hypothetical protein B0J16DRAFT_185701 [Fusarium flagelliforme]
MDIDPFVFAAFGPPPRDIDLSANSEAKNAGVVLTLLCISALFLAGRIAMRTMQVYGLSVDDYAILVSFLFVTLTAAMVVTGGYSGVGKHVWALTINQLEEVIKLTYVYSFMFVGAVFTTKVSILLFYRRIFSRGGLHFQVAFWFGAILVGAYPIIFVFTMGFCCTPVSHYWTRVKGTEGKCIDVGHFFVILAIINLITNVIVLVIPVPEVLKLQMSRGKKAAVFGILALGGLVCIASAVRIHYLNVFSTAVDTTWHMGPVAIWSSVEPSMGIVSACLPSFKSLLRHLRGKSVARASTQVSNSGGRGNNKPKFDDEIALRSQIVGGEGSMRSTQGSEADRHIFVKTSVEQTFHEMP